LTTVSVRPDVATVSSPKLELTLSAQAGVPEQGIKADLPPENESKFYVSIRDAFLRKEAGHHVEKAVFSGADHLEVA